MSTNAAYPANITDLLDGFVAPDPKVDDLAKADRTHFVLHFWPAEFPMFGREVGFAQLLPGLIHPVYSRHYQTRHHGRTDMDDFATPPGVEWSKNLAGHAVACLEDTYKQPFGLANLLPFTEAGYKWEDVKEWQRKVLPAPFSADLFPVFDQFAHRAKYLKETKAKLKNDSDRAAMDLVIWSNAQGRDKLRAYCRDRIKAAARAHQGGVDDSAIQDFEYDWMMLAGLGVPEFLARYTERTDLKISDEKPQQFAAPSSDGMVAEVVQTAVEAMAEMRQQNALQLQFLQSLMVERAASTGTDDGLRAEVESLKATIAELAKHRK